ncbi:MAG TPA: hypothetical protein DCL74_02635 [Succinivibrionaceae bacterium]|nr:hypothetical protein [Succinivibrionaceae bacterium]
MAFIKVQKLVRDGNKIVSGSASIVDTRYVPGDQYHAKHSVIERLGKVLYLNDNRREGIFLSPTRGLIAYNVDQDLFSEVSEDDPRISDKISNKAPLIHTVFGDLYLLLKFLEKQALYPVLRSVFSKKSDYERLLGHILHGVLKDGSKIHCDDFLRKSCAAYLFSDVNIDSFKSDVKFYTAMGADEARMNFFRSLVKYMRTLSPNFGKGCYVDSTPLPNDLRNNPFNALCSHGVAAVSVQMRLVLVLDEESGIPVWYDIIPGNILDLSTTMNVLNDVAVSLGVEIKSLILDAGYVTKELLNVFNLNSEKKIIGRMPAKKGFPHKQLYWDCKNLISRGKYEFVLNEHTYFGYKKEILVFGLKEYAYIYVDRENALHGFRQYLENNEDEFESLKDKDKDWLSVKYGYFVLLSNHSLLPRDLLREYFERTNIEYVFKTSKEYLGLLPISKWTDATVRGKILHDIIDTIIVLMLRKQYDSTGFSLSEIFGRCQSLMCFNNGGRICVESPNKQTKRFYSLFGLDVPATVSVFDLKNMIGNM